MKLPFTRRNFHRIRAAVLRNCLSYECAPLDCPVRKCRRDGLCAGPLVALDEGGRHRLVRSDAADIASGDGYAPVCYNFVAEDVRTRVFQAHGASLRALAAEPGAYVVETTRILAARRWRRLRGLEG